MKAVGARLPRYDGLAHVTGRTQYVDDVRVHGTLWTKALRSPHHHAGIVSLDTSAAAAMPCVHAVITHRDVPKNVYGHLEALGVPADEPLLAADEARWKGQRIAAGAAGGGGGGGGEGAPGAGGVRGGGGGGAGRRGGHRGRVRGARAGLRHPYGRR